MVRAVAAPGRWTVLAAVASASLVLTGCSSTQQPEVEQVATAFEDPGADPGTRCDLLAPATLEAFEQDEEASCAEAIQQVPLGGGGGGEIESVEIWGGDAQVRMSGDTLFLTETRAGWRITAAACEERAEAPYECEVEGP
jgi:hypothetical protein